MFREMLYPLVTSERARQVRVWRVDEDMTWRGVAGTWMTNFGPEMPEAGRDLGDNQILGMSLCELAAESLGEDPYAEPWN